MAVPLVQRKRKNGMKISSNLDQFNISLSYGVLILITDDEDEA